PAPKLLAQTSPRALPDGTGRVQDRTEANTTERGRARAHYDVVRKFSRNAWRGSVAPHQLVEAGGLVHPPRKPIARRETQGKNMANRIRTTHVGSLPRPAKVIELNHQRVVGEKFDEAGFERELKTAVVDLVAQQKKAGIDLVNDGEFGHTMGWDY